MTTPNFSQVAADIRDADAETLRIRKNLDNEAERCRGYASRLAVLAADLIRQVDYMGETETLVILHAVLRRLSTGATAWDHLTRELEMICLGLVDDIAGVEP